MARPERNNVDYFPFYCDDGNKMFYLEETYGNDGFATFVKILRELAKTNYHYLDLSKHSTLMFLSAKCKVTKETLKSIINDLVDLGKFDSVLWNENQIIWCQDFIDSIQDAYSRRNNNCMTYEGLLLHLQSLGIRKQSKSIIKGNKNPQSIVEYSKEENNNAPNGAIVFDFDAYLDALNKTFGREFRVVNSETRRKLKSTLKEYTKQDIVNAIHNCKKAKFHKDNNYQYCTPEFFARKSTLEKWSDTTETKEPKIVV